MISAFGKAQLWQRAVDLLTDLKLEKTIKTSAVFRSFRVFAQFAEKPDEV